MFTRKQFHVGRSGYWGKSILRPKVRWARTFCYEFLITQRRWKHYLNLIFIHPFSPHLTGKIVGGLWNFLQSYQFNVEWEEICDRDESRNDRNNFSLLFHHRISCEVKCLLSWTFHKSKLPETFSFHNSLFCFIHFMDLLRGGGGKKKICGWIYGMVSKKLSFDWKQFLGWRTLQFQQKFCSLKRGQSN